MIFLTRAVTRAARRPLVVGDLPFGTYEVSDEQAVASAIRMVKEGGADVVKLEGAGRMLSRVRAIADSNIGIMGHVGLTPQSATKLGGFKAQGRTATAAKQLFDDALALQEAGAFAVVLEAVPAPVAARVSAALDVPTIGIGAGAGDRRPGARVARHARHVRGPHAALRQALRGHRERDRRRRARSTPTTSAPARSPRSSTPTASPPRSSTGSRPQRQNDLSARPSTIGTATASPQAPSARCQRPAVHGAHADHEQHDGPGDERVREPAKTAPPAPESLPPRRKTSSPKTASLTGQSTSDSAIGTQANASTWRARR